MQVIIKAEGNAFAIANSEVVFSVGFHLKLIELGSVFNHYYTGENCLGVVTER